jgi:hypothetical protein
VHGYEQGYVVLHYDDEYVWCELSRDRIVKDLWIALLKVAMVFKPGGSFRVVSFQTGTVSQLGQNFSLLVILWLQVAVIRLLQ